MKMNTAAFLATLVLGFEVLASGAGQSTLDAVVVPKPSDTQAFPSDAFLRVTAAKDIRA